MSLHQLFWATGTFLSLSLSLSLFFEVATKKNGGGEGKCVVSSACRLNLSGKGTCNCKLTQLIMKQTSKLSSVICKVRIRSQQTNSPLLSPDKRARAHTHTHTHTLICCVSLVSTRKEARWSFRFFSLFTVDDEGYVQQTNKQNWTLNSNEDKEHCVATLYIYIYIYTNWRTFGKRKQPECSWTVRSRIFFHFQDLQRLRMSKGEQGNRELSIDFWNKLDLSSQSNRHNLYNTHTFRFFMAHVLLSNISYTFHTHTFVSVHCTFVLMILFFIHFRQYRLAAYRLTVTQHSASAEGVALRHAALDFVCSWMRTHNHGSLLVL